MSSNLYALETTSEIFRPVERSNRSEKVSTTGSAFTFHGGSFFGFSKVDKADAFSKNCARDEVGNCTVDSFVTALSPSSADAYATTVLPLCRETSSPFCLQEIAVNGEELKYVRTLLPYSFTYKGGDQNRSHAAAPEIGLVEGGATSIWEYPAKFSGLENSYIAITVRLGIQWRGEQRSRYSTVGYSVTPFVFSDWNQLKTWVKPPASMTDVQKWSNIDGRNCEYPIFREHQSCPQEIALKEGLNMRIVSNLPSELGGWFNGRIDEPRLSVTALTERVNRVEIEGKTLRIPRLSVVSKKGDAEFRSGTPTIYPDDAAEDVINRFVDRIRPLTGDRATGSSVTWGVRSVSYSWQKCLQNQGKLLGVVTSNALTYQGSAPKMEGGYLTYQLSGMKYEKDGSLTRGNYNLVMRSEVARCLFNLDKKQIKASVNIIYPDSTTKNVAIETFNEKNGWIYIQATNFTFSNPKVRVAIK